MDFNLKLHNNCLGLGWRSWWQDSPGRLCLSPGAGIKALLMFAFLAVTAPGWADPAGANRLITEADQGRTFACRVGEKITVSIPNPATGGYNIITPVFDHRILQLLARKELPPEPAPVPKLGDFGKLVFELEVIGVGETNLVIQIARDWEVNKSPEEYLKVKIIAQRQS